MTQPAAYLEEVRAHYEDLPYPPRNPQDELSRLQATIIDQLDKLNYYGYGGKRRFQAPFRALVAGGGTGDATLYLAEQALDFGGEVVHLDISAHSIAIAQERAAIRKLSNIRFVHDSILNLPSLGLGPFDYINASGVLHHLADPDAGLRALRDVLTEDGMIGVMVYGRYGRTGVYQMQDMLRLILQGVDTHREKIALTREVIGKMQKTHWFAFNREPFAGEIQKYGDSGLYDLLLHAQDRPYSVPEAYAWAERCGLHLVDFVDNFTSSRFLYNPATYIRVPDVIRQMAALPLKDRQAIAELAVGTMLKHHFYLGKAPAPPRPEITDESLVPFYGCLYRNLAGDETFASQFGKAEGTHIVTHIRQGKIPVYIRNQPLGGDIIRSINGIASGGDIIRAIAAKRKVGKAEVRRQFREFYADLNLHDILMLHGAEALHVPSPEALHARLETR